MEMEAKLVAERVGWVLLVCVKRSPSEGVCIEHLSSIVDYPVANIGMSLCTLSVPL